MTEGSDPNTVFAFPGCVPVPKDRAVSSIFTFSLTSDSRILPDTEPISPASHGFKAKIVVDKRDMHCAVPKELERLGIELDLRTLPVGDYVLSDRVGVERKAADDLFDTLFVRRELFSQLRDLRMAYKRPLLIIEGKGGYGALFSSRLVDPAATQGILDAISLGFGIPIYFTEDCADTAKTLSRIAIHQQTHEKRSISLHGKRSHMSRRQLQEYVISSLPDVGPAITERLLSKFGSIEGVINAPREELLKIDRVGPKLADQIRGLLTAQYAQR